jgi:hypothetical protein
MCSISIAACFIFCNHSPLFYDNFGSEVWLNGFQSTFLDDSISVEHAREYGHTHLFEVLLEIFQECLFIPKCQILVFTVKVIFGNADSEPV